MEPLPRASIRDPFAQLTDPRSDHTKHHQLLDLVTIARGGVLCGAESGVEIEQFGNAKLSLYSAVKLGPTAALTSEPTRGWG